MPYRNRVEQIRNIRIVGGCLLFLFAAFASSLELTAFGYVMLASVATVGFFSLFLFPSFLNTASDGDTDLRHLFADEFSGDEIHLVQGKREILVSPKKRQITFLNCHLRNSFWTIRSQAEFTCRFDDLLDVYFVVDCYRRRHNREKCEFAQITIVTNRGKAQVNSPIDSQAAKKGDQICKMLKPVCQRTPSAPITEHPAFVPVVGFAGGTIVLIVICYFAFR